MLSSKPNHRINIPIDAALTVIPEHVYLLLAIRTRVNSARLRLIATASRRLGVICRRICNRFWLDNRTRIGATAATS